MLPSPRAHRAPPLAASAAGAMMRPMAITETDPIGPVHRVMVGTDRSETATRAVAWAASFAERFGAELHVVQVIVPEHAADTEHGAAEATRARSAADELQVYTTQLAGERGHAHVVIDDDPAMAIVRSSEDQAVDVLIVGNAGMAGRKEFLLGNVPNRISHNARCTVIIVNTTNGQTTAIRGTGTSGAIRSSTVEPVIHPHLVARGTKIGVVFAKHGLRELFGRPDEEGAVGRRRQAKRLRSRARGSRSHVLQARADPLDPAGPPSPRVHRGTRDPAGQRAAPVGGTGRLHDGAGARRALGGRVRDRGAPAARRRDDRAGPSRLARHGAEGRDQDPASRRSGVDRTGPGAARGLRGEGREAPEPEARDRHGGRLPAPVGLAPARARLPSGGVEHGADRRGARVVPAPRGARGPPRPVDVAPPRDARRGRRADRHGAGGCTAARGRPSAARVLLQADHGRRLLPRRPAPGEPDVAAGGGTSLLPRPRDGRRGGSGDARAADAAADGVLPGRRGVPHRCHVDARERDRAERPRRGSVPRRRSARSWPATGPRR